MRLAALLVLAPCLVLCSAPAHAELWRWIDANGVVRYTPNPSRVPGGARGSLTKVEAGMPAVARAPAPAAAAAPGPLYAPADEFSFEADPFNAPDRAQTLRGEDLSQPLDPSATAPLGEPRATPAATPAPAPATPAAAPAPAPAPAPATERAAPKPAAQAATPPVASQPPLDAAQRERRDVLAEQIARDEAALKTLISSGENPSGQPSDELRAIAERLPQLQAELRELESGADGGSDSKSP